MTIHRQVPMLSPVLEDFVPPQFRGNMPDSPSVDSPVTVPPVPDNWWQSPLAAGEKKTPNSDRVFTGMYANIVMKLLQWRKSSQTPVGSVSTKKAVKIHKLQRKSQKNNSKGRDRHRSGLFSFNPLCLFCKLRDSYINMMNNVATTTSINVMGGNFDGIRPLGGEFLSQEFDAVGISKLVELEKSSSKPDTEYRSNMSRLSRNPSRVEPYGDINTQLSRFGPEALSRSRNGSRNGSNQTDDDIFFSKSRSKKVRENPYANPYASSSNSKHTGSVSKDAVTTTVSGDVPTTRGSISPVTGLKADASSSENSQFHRSKSRTDTEYRLKQLEEAEAASSNFSFQSLI